MRSTGKATGLGMLLVAVVLLGLLQTALAATEAIKSAIPDSLQLFIQGMDSGAKLREDGLITLSDGTEYVVVLPPNAPNVPTFQVIRTIPEGARRPDFLELNEGYFLLKMVALPNGRKSFPLLQEVPLSVRSGLLPQNFTFPEGFLLPTIWKSLTGNLLNPVDTSQQAKASLPFAVPSPELRSVFVWDAAQGQVQQRLPLVCAPAGMAVSQDAKTLYVGCVFQPKLYSYSLRDGSVQSYELSAPVGQLLLDPERSRLYISHPTQPKLTAFDLNENKVASVIPLNQPVFHMAISPFRQMLYAAAIEQDPEKPQPKPHKSFFNRVFLSPPEVKRPERKIPLSQQGTLYFVRLNPFAVDKAVPTFGDLVLLHIQNEKVLWMASRTEKNLMALDLRWQEFVPKIPVPEIPRVMASNDQWLYLLMPESNTLQKYSLKNLVWGAPIALEPNVNPTTMVLDPWERQAYILSGGSAGIQVVNMDRGEWVGTEKTDFPGTGLMTWITPPIETMAQRVRIRFQDGRFLLQNAPGPQSVTSPSDPHDPPNNPNPPEPSEKPPAPEAG